MNTPKKLITLMILLIIFSCKKEKTATPQTTNIPSVVTNTQDSRLIGVWVKDSVSPGQSASNWNDTLFISKDKYYEMSHGSFVTPYYEWYTTHNDSVFLSAGAGVINDSYKYGFVLTSLLMQQDSIKFYFHKK